MNSKRSQFSEFCGGQAESASNKPLSDIVSKNKLASFSTHQAKQRSRSKEQVASLKTNCTLFSRTYMACQARQCNLDSFFEHGNQACPLDGAAIVHNVQARSLSTFEEYSQEMILPYITPQLETVNRVDIVWDKYLTNSLKQSIVERTVALHRDNVCLKERLFRRTGRLS